MEKTSVLMVIERDDAMHRGVGRALMLARYLHARLDIMFCDIAGPSMRPSATALASASTDAREYLNSLRNYIIAPDIEITTEAAFEESVHDHVRAKLHRTPCALVIKSVGREYDLLDIRPAWDLIRSCPVPVLLTHGEPWHPVARFAAAVAVINPQAPGLPLDVVSTADSLRAACDGHLDLVYVEDQFAAPPGGTMHPEPRAQLRLQALSRRLNDKSSRIHTLTGDFVEALPRFARHQEYDLLALGAACTADAPERGLLEHLLRLTTCDLLFVKPAAAMRLPIDAPRSMAREQRSEHAE